MSVSYAQAELGCIRSRGKLFYIEEGMNLHELFALKGLESVWTGIFISHDRKAMLDGTDLAPLTFTNNERINIDLLNPSLIGIDQKIILQKIGDKFHYVPADKTQEHRALCLQKIPFPRQDSSMLTLSSLRTQMVHEIKDMVTRVTDLSRMVNVTLSVLPKFPAMTLPLGKRTVLNMNERMLAEIVQIGLISKEIINGFSKLVNPDDLDLLMAKHAFILKKMDQIEKEIVAPLYRPLSLVEVAWRSEMEAGSTIAMFTNEMEELLIKIEPEVLEIPTTTIRPESTSVSASENPTTTMPFKKWYPPTTTPAYDDWGVDIGLENFFNLFKPAEPTPKTAPVPTKEKSFQDWFLEQVQLMHQVATHLSSYPSIWDISLSIGFLIHTIVLIVFSVKYQKKVVKKPIVKKLRWSSVLRSGRKSKSKKVSSKKAKKARKEKKLDNEIIEMESYTPSAPKTKKIRYDIDSDEEGVPMYPGVDPVVKVIRTTHSHSQSKGKGTTKKHSRPKAYLAGDVPIYLVGTDSM